MNENVYLSSRQSQVTSQPASHPVSRLTITKAHTASLPITWSPFSYHPFPVVRLSTSLLPWDHQFPMKWQETVRAEQTSARYRTRERERKRTREREKRREERLKYRKTPSLHFTPFTYTLSPPPFPSGKDGSLHVYPKSDIKSACVLRCEGLFTPPRIQTSAHPCCQIFRGSGLVEAAGQGGYCYSSLVFSEGLMWCRRGGK